MRTVDMLETRGLVRRDPDPSDRRKHSVALTDTGAELLTRTLTEVRQAEREFAVTLSDQERAQLLGLLKRLLNSGERS
jgi:DNA-binding MarR family transcriptional regulator